MSFKDYCRRVLNEETDIISVKAKLDAKKRGLKHQSHNVWKDKGGQEYKWNKVLKRFEKIEGSKEEKRGEVAFYAKSDQATKWPVDTSGKKVDPTQLEKYDFDEPLTHESGSDFDGVINKEGIFNGVFTLEGLKGNALGLSGYHHTYIPRKDAVAREGSIDLDEEKALDFIKNEYPDATQEQLEVIEAVAVRDKPLLDVVEDEYGEEDVVGFFNNLIYGDNAGEIEWVLQGLRGQIALDQGFDAIAMRDENGTSYLIPVGSKALYLGKVNSYDDLEKIKNNTENTKGASFAKSD